MNQESDQEEELFRQQLRQHKRLCVSCVSDLNGHQGKKYRLYIVREFLRRAYAEYKGLNLKWRLQNTTDISRYIKKKLNNRVSPNKDFVLAEKIIGLLVIILTVGEVALIKEAGLTHLSFEFDPDILLPFDQRGLLDVAFQREIEDNVDMDLDIFGD
jgi:hypothetical protein